MSTTLIMLLHLGRSCWIRKPFLLLVQNDPTEWHMARHVAGGGVPFSQLQGPASNQSRRSESMMLVNEAWERELGG